MGSRHPDRMMSTHWILSLGALAGALLSPPTSAQGGANEHFAAGKKAEDAGQLEAAAKAYRKALRAAPDRIDLVIALGRTLRTRQLSNDALDLLEPALKKHPKNPELLSETALTYHFQAENMLRRGVTDTTVTLLFQEAKRLTERGVKLAPDHRQLRLLAAQSCFQLGELDQSKAHALAAAETFGDHPGGHTLVGKIAFQEFVAHRRAADAAKRGSKTQKASLDAAKLARDEVEGAMGRAIQADPKRPFPHIQLGDISAWVGNSTRALEHYRDALVLAPGAAVNHTWLLQNVKSAAREKFYKQVVDVYLATPGATVHQAGIPGWWYAYALYEQGKNKLAAATFEQVAAANPEYRNSHAYAMLAHYWGQDHSAAERQAALYAKAAPKHFADHVRKTPEKDETIKILEYLADRSYKAGHSRISRDINHVVAMLKDSAAYWNNYAFLCRETGVYEESLRAYENALSLDPESPQLLNDCAVILQYHLANSVNRKRARAMYRRAIRNAAKVLDDKKSTTELKRLARTAGRDARNNLAKLGS